MKKSSNMQEQRWKEKGRTEQYPMAETYHSMIYSKRYGSQRVHMRIQIRTMNSDASMGLNSAYNIVARSSKDGSQWHLFKINLQDYKR